MALIPFLLLAGVHITRNLIPLAWPKYTGEGTSTSQRLWLALLETVSP